MVTKELSEAAVEFNCILEYTSTDIINKIPKKFIDFLKSIQSTSYNFEYDETKKLNEQKLLPKTRGLIALVYQDYICSEIEKQEYIQKCQIVITQMDEQKRERYNPNDIFQNKKIEKNNKLEETALIEVKDEKLFNKIRKFIKDIFSKKR